MNFKKNYLIYPVALLLLFSFRSNTVRFSQKSGRSDDPVGKVLAVLDGVRANVDIEIVECLILRRQQVEPGEHVEAGHELKWVFRRGRAG